MARVLLCNKATSSAARVARHKLEGAIRDNTDALAKVLTQARYERSVGRVEPIAGWGVVERQVEGQKPAGDF